MIRLLLADDQALVRGALAALLGLEHDIEVVSEVGLGEDVGVTSLHAKPEVALLDVDMPGLDGIAAAGYAANPKIPTFVIGVGSSLSNLNGIAMAGGTTSAFLVDTGGNVNQQFLQAMNDIRHAALGCTYSVPTDPNGGTVDYGSVNIVYQPGNGGPPVTLPYVMDKANCPAMGNGWYYDNPQAPTKILLCDSSCSGIELDATGSVNITLGCTTVIQ